jgi:uncharacterized Tic20 family protein
MNATREPAEIPGYRLAVAAESLYLVNLMLAPGLAFLPLAWLWLNHHRDATPLARCHLDQTFQVSLIGGTAIVVAIALIIAAGGLNWAWTWVIVVLYFTLIHSTLIMFGMVGLAKALSGKLYVYPLVGRRCDE